MEKDIGSITKNPETEIVLRIDDFGGKRGLTIREFVRSERYTGFTKSGTRITAENFEAFKKMINSINPEELKEEGNTQQALPQEPKEEQTGIDEEGLL